MAEIINIKNDAGEVQYPVTKPECVIDENGKSVLTLIQENGTELRQEIDELSTETETIRIEVESQNELIGDLYDMKIDKEADDYYPQLAVGLADNLSGVDVVDSEVNFRRSGGGAISDGVARIEAIKGNSVVWNQLALPFNELTNTSFYSFSIANGVLTITALREHAASSAAIRMKNSTISGHSYLFTIDGSNSQNTDMQYRCGSAFNRFSVPIANAASEAQLYIYPFGALLTTIPAGATATIKSWEIHDLTQMFQAGNEPTTIEEFYARKPIVEDEYVYNEGEVIHMDVQSVESQGINAWGGSLFNGYISDGHGGIMRPDISDNKCTGFVRVLPNTQYYIRTDATSGRWGAWYDKDQNFISGLGGVGPHKSPSNAEYMRMTIVYNNDGNPDTFGINISDASINGKYFPYVKRTEDLSIIRKYFPQGMMKAGSAHDEIRYNKVTQKWEYSKGRFKSVDLGTFNWIQATATDGFKYYYTSKGLSDAAYENKGNNILTPRYTPAKKGANEFADKDMRLFSDKLLYIRDDAYTDASTFKAAMQGVILYYEAADWEWVELDAEDQFKDLDYQVWNCGTEKAIAEGKSAPLAADITYGFNAIGKIKELEEIVKALQSSVLSLASNNQ